MKIYFHIGQAKTGSSAIQSFLHYNREILAKQHYLLYPNFSTNDFAGKSLLHNHGHFFHKINQSDGENKYKDIENCLRYSSKNRINRIVFSAEMFEFEWLPVLINEASIICKFDYTIILYLRRQDYYLEAAWKQWGHKMQDVKAIHDYSKKVHLNWYSTIQLWLKHISPEKFILRPYEKSVIGENIIIDFMSLLGVDSRVDLTDPPDNNHNKNHGFSNDIIEILRLCNKSYDGNIHNHSVLDFLYNSLSNHYKKSPMTSYNLLSPNERLKIIEQYSILNNKLASIFWGENAVLFNDPLPDPDEAWTPTGSLSVEKIIPIFMELILHQHGQIQTIKENTQMGFAHLRESLRNLRESNKNLRENNMNLTKNMKLLINMQQLKNAKGNYETLTWGNKKFENITFSGLDLAYVFHRIKIRNQISSWAFAEAGLEFVSEGNDPYFFLHKSLLVKRLKAIRLEITAPGPAILQVFYKTRILQSFNEANSIHKPLKEGRNILNLLISVNGVSGSLRIDPGNFPGKFIIHKIQIGS